jgi:hypothetical protein
MQEIGAGIAADTTLVTSVSTLCKIIGTTMNMHQDTKNSITTKEMIAAMSDMMNVETTTEIIMVMIIEAMSTAVIIINFL